MAVMDVPMFATMITGNCGERSLSGKGRVSMAVQVYGSNHVAIEVDNADKAGNSMLTCLT